VNRRFSWVIKATLALLLGGSLLGCSPIKSQFLRGDYDKVDKFKVKRLRVTLAPLPLQRADLGKLWRDIVETHISQKKNYILKSVVALKAKGELKAHCVKGVEGWLHFKPLLVQKGNQVAVAVEATMWRCYDGKKVWSTSGGGSWASVDKELTAMTASYAKKYGKAIKAFVAPSARLLFPVIENLPNPKLNEQDLIEKIQSS
jgi:probable lipoprotein (TIGR04455 family)